MSKKNILRLGILIMLFFILRIPAILFSFDNIYFDGDELSRGALAKEIMEKPMLPLFDYLDGDAGMYEGGRLLIAFITVPFFKILGDSYFSLKMVSIFLSVIMFILWYILSLKFFNHRVALFWSLLFILSPPLYTQASLVTWGAHAEYYFFTALFLTFFHKIYFEHELSCVPIWVWATFGFFSGFGFWIIQHNALVLAVCFIFFFLKDKKLFLKKYFWVYFFFLLIGYSPHIYQIFTRYWRHSAVYDSVLVHFPGEELRYMLPKLFSLIVKDFPHSLLFNHQIISYIYYFIFLFSFIYFIRLNKRNITHTISKEFIFLAYFGAYLFVYTIGDFSVYEDNSVGGFLRYNYLTLVYPVMFLIVACFLNRIWELGKRVICVLLASFFIVAGFWANISLISFKNFGQPLREKGYSYFDLGDRLPLGLSKEGLQSLVGNLKWVNPKYGPEFLKGISAGMAFNESVNQDIPGTLELFTKIPQEYQVSLYEGWGVGLNDIVLSNPAVGIEIVYQVDKLIADKYKKYFHYELGRGIITHAESINGLENLIIRMAGIISPPGRKYFYEGVIQGLSEVEDAGREGLILMFSSLNDRGI